MLEFILKIVLSKSFWATLLVFTVLSVMGIHLDWWQNLLIAVCVGFLANGYIID